MDSADAEPLSKSERAELEKLRAEFAARQPSERRRGEHSGLRWVGVWILLVLILLLSFAGVLARYARSELLDSERYVQTVAPLGSNPVIQGEITNRITDEIDSQLDIEKVTADALATLTENAERVPQVVVGLAPVIADQAKSFIHQTVGSVVSSDAFENLWVEANREAHQSLTAVLTGDTRAAVDISDKGEVSISLAPMIEKARSALVDRGFAFADRIPDIDKSFVIFESPKLVKAQRLVSALDKASAVLPWVILILAAGAIWCAPRGSRLRTLSLVGITVAVAMALLAVSLSIGRAVYLDDIPSDVLSQQAAGVIVDTLLLPLKTSLRAVFVLGVVVAIVGYLTGGSSSALAVRRGFSKAVDSVRSPSADREPRAIETVCAKYIVALRVLIVVIAVAVLVFWRYPSGVVVAVTVLVTVLALVALEVIARPARVR
ncbi:hypothetical protein FFI94_004065 [Rhodococcus sp. KBS0724]|uniref:hypothetical protein n=1 Tax=Rhodococcus sp. KBS0724 TaxID=1179674 RepID=UPI00110E2455|nr:hypothetical protein [Rhodococcus sp. KBS0724]TSD45417.1 hypothetical protein FFI94_004065 [Rhodococcus sp. KBS0724]